MKEDIYNDNLESFFRSTLDNMDEVASIDEWDVPSDRVWEGIMAHSEKTRAVIPIVSRRRKYLRWSSAAAAAVVLISVLFSQLTNYNSKIDALSEEVKATTQELKDVKEKLAYKDNPSLEAPVSGIENEFITNEQTVNNNSFSGTTISGHSTQNVDKPVDKIENNLPPTNEAQPSLIINNSFNALAVTQDKELTPKEMIPTTNIKKLNWELDEIKSLYPHAITPNDQPIVVMQNEEMPKMDIDFDPQDLGIQKPSLSIAAFYAPSLNYRNVKGTTEYTKLLDRKESAKFTSSQGLRLTYHLSDDWAIETGVAYSQHAMNLKHKANIRYETDRETLNNNGAYESTYTYQMPSSYGNIETNIAVERAVDDLIEDDQMIPLDIQSTQDLHFVTIPVAAKYHIGKKPLQLTVKAGMQANLLTSNSLEIEKVNPQFNGLVHNNTSTRYEEKRELKKVTFGYLVGIGLVYHLNNDWSIFVEPTYAKSLNPIYDRQDLQSYPTTASINMGLNYHF